MFFRSIQLCTYASYDAPNSTNVNGIFDMCFKQNLNGFLICASIHWFAFMIRAFYEFRLHLYVSVCVWILEHFSITFANGEHRHRICKCASGISGFTTIEQGSSVRIWLHLNWISHVYIILLSIPCFIVYGVYGVFSKLAQHLIVVSMSTCFTW